uniref:Uncharacterized protein, isoform C n=1 Tax=Drosophila melanogaster TaxID=7227 RepID=A0A0R4YDN3_DROME|nr:uncharacterized protein Dmel_CG14974, isoform C [Drosophila melanogaster]AGB94069.2 uncharacterized protein Dmel_CG14974, isoform C [Drosophila melanogaster]|eukprot:NP_001303361.1 uncharacterized protein Dmel_CG14974, isoform C [Drosophila melanogaster]
MNPNSRCLALLFVALSFLAQGFFDSYRSPKESGLATLCQEIQKIQDDFVHLADNCSIEKLTVNDSLEYLQISCHVDDLPEGYERRLKPVDYGRSFFLNQRMPKPLKRQWNFRVPTDAVNGLSLLT